MNDHNKTKEQLLEELEVLRRQAARGKVDEALRESEQYLRRLVEASPIAMVVSSGVKEKVILINKKFSELFGYTLEDIPDVAHWWPLAYPDEAYREEIKAKWTAQVEKAIKDGGEIEPVEARITCKDGSIRDVEFRLSSIDEKNLVTFIDLTERKRAEEALRESERKYREVFNNVSDSLFVFDVTGDGRFRFNDINATAEKISGVSIADAKGKFFEEIVRPEQASHALPHFLRCIETGIQIHYDEEYLKPTGGRLQYLRTSLLPIRSNGGSIVRLIVVNRDITESRMAEVVLRQSEEKYRTLFEESFDGLFITSPGGKILDMNRKGVKMLGYDTEEEMQRLDLFKDIYAEPVDRERILAMVNVQGTAEYEVVVKKKNGEKMITHCSLTAVKDKEGVITSYRGIIRDITERKRAERELRESEEKFAAAFHASPNLIAITRVADGTILEVNEGYSQLLGYSRAESIGKTTAGLAIWANPADRDTFIATLEKFGQINDFETTLRRKDGTLLTVIDSARTIDFGGEAYVLSVVHDITERKRMEDELKNLNADLGQKVTHLGVINRIDRAILSSLNIREVFTMLHADLKKLIGYDAMQIGIIEQEELHFLAFMKEGTIREYRGPLSGSAIEKMKTDSLPILRKDLNFEKAYNEEGVLLKMGQQSLMLFPLIFKEIVIGNLAVASERKEAFSEQDVELMTSIANQLTIAVENATLYQDLEAKVAQRTAELAVKNRKLEELAQMRAEFISTASHDLRAPLTGILGFAELLLTEKAGPLNETEKRYIQTIHKSGKDLLNIIEDFLDLSRIDAGKLTVNKEEFNIIEGINRSMASIESLFVSKKLRISIDVGENLPATDADPNRFNQMLTNYLSNALKFTNEGGTVTIRARQEGNFIRISVIDTGIGISWEDQKKLFQRFFQAEATKYTIKGTGLGLSIVKQLAEIQGGHRRG